MENLKSSFSPSQLKTAQMDIPAINACGTYSYGFSSVHRQLAKAKAQRESRLQVTEADVAATASEACKIYLSQLEARPRASEKSQPQQSTSAESYQA